ncbi:MAG: hypothetical protein IPF94_00215 [Betaproteobacteria bacterium]|nr:hypothetical protein [Betaproteobacteria bacterium]
MTRPSTERGSDAQNLSEGRRRFLRRGAATTPLLLTLTAQPALGFTCYSPSGSLSKNTSGGRNYTGDCTGKSPGNYKAQIVPGPGDSYNWPTESYVPGDRLIKMFPAGPFLDSFMADTTTTKTLLQVLNLGGNGDPYQFAAHMIAAVLNCVNGFVPAGVMTEGQLRTIWTALYTAGTIQVGSEHWDKERFVQYLTAYKIGG